MNFIRHARENTRRFVGMNRIGSQKGYRNKKGMAPKGHPGWCRVSDPLITGPLQKHQVGKIRKDI